ncbi:hypothetical protein KC660_04645 [Candidatus Dojkabacteria bacterium]|uniref:Uncharacterized protein n=1 Tax=Candidatus Dojkabacteria bacterium TaxID=2099670 RepID=A0A955RIR5_9BACT|nr:hypothetical protein [Candidatus Dojkabacteria bacterium]
MKLVNESIKISELKKMSENMYGDLVKAVVDIKQGIMVVDAPMHADQEKFLLEKGSNQENLWGINLYPEFYGESDFLEYDSMINLRPNQNNLTRGVDDEQVREQIKEVVDKLVKG